MISRQRAWQERRRAEGRCRACGQPSDGMASCAGCREKQREVVREWREAFQPPAVGLIEPSSCVRCHRTLDRVDRKHETPRFEPERCGWCAIPLTDEAKAKLCGPVVPVRALEEVAATC